LFFFETIPFKGLRYNRFNQEVEMNIKSNSTSRRGFLKLVAGGAVALTGLAGCGSKPGSSSNSTRIDIGPAANFPVGTRTVLKDIPALLFHDDQGFRAFSLVCTHQGCTVNLEGDVFKCPCHGSQFALDGSVTQGPAAQSLRQYKVDKDANKNLILS
jgi:cytochrome b6-f complex iron-sulfur subunit